MGIADDDVARVRQASDIVAIVSQHTQLRKSGTQWTGLCPFHNEKSPSFSVNGNEGVYYCFGCQVRGDVITFVREIEHLDFVGAVEWLAAKAGIALTYTDADQGAGRKRRNRLQEVMERAVDWYHERLVSGPDAGAARAYLRQRGFDRPMVDEYRLGWAPGGWDALVRHLNVPDDVLVDTGLGMRNKANRQQDFFRGRILFPIFDDQGRPVAFGGRKLPDAEGPKYQNSRENLLYRKSSTLYGLNWAKSDIVKANEAIVCEGYTDVIGFFRAGVPRAVATCGTALTEDHLRSLKRFTKRVVLAYDADEAGQHAAERLYEWEARHEVEFSVLALPPGADPDELSRSDPEALAAAVAGAKPFLGFRVSRVLDAADVRNPEGRARAAAAALDVIAEHPSAFLRDQYLMEVADVCRGDVDQLREQLTQRQRQRSRSRSQGAVGSGRSSGSGPSARRRSDDEPPPHGDLDERPDDGDPGPGGPGSVAAANLANGRSRPLPPLGETAEVEALRLMVQRRDEIVGWLRPMLFVDPRTAAAFAALSTAPDARTAIESAPPEVADLLTRLSVTETSAEVLDVAARLLDEATVRALSVMEATARTSEDPLAYAPAMSWLKLRLADLRGDDSSMESAPDLLAWLDENSAEFS